MLQWLLQLLSISHNSSIHRYFYSAAGAGVIADIQSKAVTTSVNMCRDNSVEKHVYTSLKDSSLTASMAVSGIGDPDEHHKKTNEDTDD